MEFDVAFDEFVASASARPLRSAYLLTGDRDDSEDLLQIVDMLTPLAAARFAWLMRAECSYPILRGRFPARCR